ncbi:hypothetical protein [Mucilaginibacter sp. dw_454]|uniref:hypothetical protein n=1 Tax=Mucilaginibacter sp. dw_454 TaxID=2720079 RepID=UPI001BD5059E|nr:hypothetical protein [Mucilaginibacter sp. dw_454]
MKRFDENVSVVYTDTEGRQIDTFVIFATDEETGLTRINHENLSVPAESLRLHAKTVGKYHLPIADAFSFEIIRKLRDKYAELDARVKQEILKPELSSPLTLLARAS